MAQVSDSTQSNQTLARLKESYDAEKAESRASHQKEVDELKQQSSKELETERDHARVAVSRLKENLYTREAQSQAESDQRLDEALANKDQKYKQYLAEKNERTAYELSERDQKIHSLSTTDDPLKISPQAVQKIQNAAEARYFAKLTEEQRVNESKFSGLRDHDVDARRELQKNYESKFTEVSKDARKQLDEKDRNFGTAYSALDQKRSDSDRTANERQHDALTRMQSKHSLELVDAQKDKREALDVQQDALLADKRTTIEDLNESKRDQNREWSQKTNDVRRNLESKLADERDVHERQTSEMKREFDQKFREQDRTSKRVLDDRVRSYEHQLKQQELAFKEKQRFLTEHYEEELDSMKRTNAYLNQKKS